MAVNLNEILFDTDEYLRSLRESDYTEKQARGNLNALKIAIRGSVATTQALFEVRNDLKEEIAALRSEMKEEIAALRSEMKEEIAKLRSEAKSMENRLMITMVATIGVATTILGLVIAYVR